MYIVIGLAIGLMIAGLVIMVLAPKTGSPSSLLTTLVWWIGLILLIVGVILFLTPIILWLNTQLRAMLDLH